jgi:hypothetical protein
MSLGYYDSNETRSTVVDNRVDGCMSETTVGKEFFAEGDFHVQVSFFEIYK